MNHRHSSRRYRRPAPLPATRAQIRQRIHQLRNLYLEVTLDDLHTAFMNQDACSIEEEL